MQPCPKQAPAGRGRATPLARKQREERADIRAVNRAVGVGIGELRVARWKRGLVGGEVAQGQEEWLDVGAIEHAIAIQVAGWVAGHGENLAARTVRGQDAVGVPRDAIVGVWV